MKTGGGTKPTPPPGNAASETFTDDPEELPKISRESTDADQLATPAAATEQNSNGWVSPSYIDPRSIEVPAMNKPEVIAPENEADIAFAKLIGSKGVIKSSRPTEPVDLFYPAEEFERRRGVEPDPPRVSRLRRRAKAVGAVAILTTEGVAGAVLDLGSPAGQFAGGMFFATLAYLRAVPELRSKWRETKPKHQAGRTAKERARDKY